MKPQYPIALIFSVFRTEFKLSNNVNRHLEASLVLEQHKVPFKEVAGQFEGRIESSFVVFGDKAVELGLKLAREYNQDSAILLDQDRNATLIDLRSNNKVNIGKFTPVPEHVAKQSIGWTFDKVTKQFFICE